jgi:hypothetical protein
MQKDQKIKNVFLNLRKTIPLVSLFTMKQFLEVDNKVILLSNNWIWY